MSIKDRKLGNIIKRIRLRKHSFILKMSIAFAGVIAICFGIFGAALYQYSSKILRNQIIQDQKLALSQIADHISYVQDTLKMTAQSIAIANDVQQNVRMENEGTLFQQLVRKKEMRTLLGSYVMMLPYCHDIQIITEHGTGYSSNNTENLYDSSDVDWFTEWKTQNKNMGFSKIHDYYNEQGQTHEQVISYIITFKDLTDLQNTLGYIILHIDRDSIVHIGDEANSPENIILYNGDGEIITGSSQFPEYGEIVRHGEEYVQENGNVVISDRSLGYDWILATEISESFIGQKIHPILKLLIFFLIFFIAFVCVGLYFTVWHYTRPVSLLTDAAKEVSAGKFDLHLDIRSDDEFMLLGNAFNEMVVNIKRLLEESVAYEKREKENEINRLMLQINPHFIYNTLNSIVYMAKLNRNEDIIVYTNAFISLLQDTLRMDANSVFVPFRQELENVRNYIILQKIRYLGLISVKYDIAEEVLDMAVPNIFIQPIVENAIYHGLAQKRCGGNLEICVQKEKGVLKIAIKDDGVGMTEEKVKQLLLENDSDRSGMRKIGIANVYSRILHIYGDEYGMEIQSEPGKGTEIIISIQAVPYSE